MRKRKKKIPFTNLAKRISSFTKNGGRTWEVCVSFRGYGELGVGKKKSESDEKVLRGSFDLGER